MGKEKSEKNKGAYVTVYFILVLSVIISLILVSLESARLETAKTRSLYCLNMAAEGILADYYAPLYDEYHILAYDGGYGGTLISKEMLSEELMRLLRNNYENSASKGIVCGNRAEKVTVINIETLISNDGAAFFNQAVSFQKYKAAEEAIELILAKIGLADVTRQAKEIINAKTEAEKQLAKVDKKLIELIEYMDGIRFIGLDEGGGIERISTVPDFARKFTCTGYPEGINNTSFRSMVKKYSYNISDLYDNLLADAQEYIVRLEAAKQLEDELEAAYVQRQQLEDEIKTANENNDKMAVLEKNFLLQNVKSDISMLEGKIIQNKNEAAFYKAAFEGMIKDINSAAALVEERCVKCCKTVQDIRDNLKEAENKMKVYDNVLSAAGMIIDDEQLATAQEYIDMVNNYINAESGNFPADIDMAEDIANRISAGAEAYLSYNSLSVMPESAEDIRAWREYAYEAFERLKECADTSQWFDYSQIYIVKTDSSIIKMIKEFINSGIAGMVYENPDELSKSTYTGIMLPSSYYDCTGFSAFAFDDIFESIIQMDFSGFNEELNGRNAAGGIKDTGKALINKALFIMYLEEHFEAYDLENDMGHILKYEHEYMLSDNQSDRSNLNSMVMKIISIRFVINLMYAVTNSECCSKAETMAAALLGFTGFTGLITAARYIILIFWAFAAALTDVAAVISGYTIPFLELSEGLSVKFEELLLLTKENIKIYKKRYENYSDYGVNYRDYVRMFMFITDKEVLSLKAMDLIQGNLKGVYEEGMYLKNGIVKMDIQLEDSLVPCFINTGLFKYGTDFKEYQISTKITTGYD